MKLTRRSWTWLILLILAVVAVLAINAPGLIEFAWRMKMSTLVANLPDAPAIQPSDRLLIIAPHPDDELLACGGTILAAVRAGARVDVLWLTNGDGFEWDEAVIARTAHPSKAEMLKLGEQRMDEARAAARVLGVPPSNLHFLGYPDGGLLRLFLDYYQSPYTSRLTGAEAVPYRGAVHPGAPFTGRSLEADLGKVMDAVKPTLIFVPAPQDHHLDHRAACYFALRVCSVRNNLDCLRTYIVHGGMEWPLPKGLHPDLPLAPPPRGRHLAWLKVSLSATDEMAKLAALKEYKSQLRTLPHFLEAFIRTNELYSLGVEPS